MGEKNHTTTTKFLQEIRMPVDSSIFCCVYHEENIVKDFSDTTSNENLFYVLVKESSDLKLSYRLTIG